MCSLGPGRHGSRGSREAWSPAGSRFLVGLSPTPGGAVAVLIQLAQPPQGPVLSEEPCPTG